jgi:hypothetical protein
MLVPWWSYGPYGLDGFRSWGWSSFVGFLGALALLCTRLVTSAGRPAVSLPLPLNQAYGICAALELIGAVLYLALTVPHLGFSGVSAGVFMALLGGGATLVAATGLRTPSLVPVLAGSPSQLPGPRPPHPGQGAAPAGAPPCPACGRPNARLTRFCEGCGAKTGIGDAVPGAGEATAPPLAPATSQPAGTDGQVAVTSPEPLTGSPPPVAGAPIGADDAGPAGAVPPTGGALGEDG